MRSTAIRKKVFHLRATATCSLVVGIVLGLAGRAAGQITAAVYEGPGDFAYDVQSMPDLDQRRSGLDFDGSMYCVPTACMNLCAFAANFGFPELGPGPGLWEGAPGHLTMTNYIWWMGLPEYMNTDPDPNSNTGGTNGSGKENGMFEWISYWGQPMCYVLAYPDDEGYWPTVDRAAIQGANGAVVQLSYGRYAWSEILGLPYLSDRQGGHAVTLKLAFADNGSELGDRLIHYRDPGTDEGDLFSNSDFDSKWPMTAANITIRTGLHGTPQPYAVTSLDNPPISDAAGRYQIIDSYLALYPGGGLSYDDVEVNSQFVTGSLGFAGGISPEPWDVGQVQGQAILAAVPHPLLHSRLALVSISGQQRDLTQLYEIPHHGRHRHLLDLPVDARCLALGFGHTVYVATDSHLYELIVMNGAARLKSTTKIPPSAVPQIDAIAYDGLRNQVIVAKGREICFLTPRRLSRPRFIPIRGLESSPHPIRSLVVDGRTVFAATENDGVAAATINAFVRRYLTFQPLNLPGVSEPLSVDVDSYGRLYVSDESNGLYEFVKDRRGDWTRAENAYYNGADFVGRRFVVFRNRMNVDPSGLDFNQWYNVDPDELANLGPDIPDVP